jgi:hypothetical protein
VLAADWPIVPPTIEQAIARMPEAARRDLLEWHPDGCRCKPRGLGLVLKQRIDVATPAAGNERLGITDDRPFNEYFWLRRTFGGDGTFLEKHAARCALTAGLRPAPVAALLPTPHRGANLTSGCSDRRPG